MPLGRGERAGRGEQRRIEAECARLDLEQGVALERARPEGVVEQHTDRQERERECAEAGEEEQKMAANRTQQR